MKDKIPQLTASSQNLLYEICELCHVVKEKLGTFLLDETSVMSYVQQNKPELLTKAINSSFEATIDHMLKASSFLVSFKSPKGTTKQQFLVDRLGNKDAIAQTFKDAKGNYIICPHDLVANIMTSMRSNGGTLTDKIRVLVYLVIWSCLSQDCYYSITLALLITDKRIKHHLNSFQFDQGEITKDCIWHWLQCLTMCIMCTGSLSFQKMYTMTTHACLVFALPAAILDSCHIFTQIGVNPVGPIFNINPCDVLSPEILETSILKENPVLLMTHTFTLWCSRRLKEEIGRVKTTDHLQTIAESFKWSGENASSLMFFTKNFSSIDGKEKFSMCMVSEEPTPKPEMSKRGNLPLNAKGPALTTNAFPKEKVLRKPTGLQVQPGPRGRGRGRKALTGGDYAMSVGCNEQGLPVGGCPHRTPPHRKSPQKSPRHECHDSSPGTSLSSNTIQEMQSKKRKTPMKTAKTALTPTRKSPRKSPPKSPCH